MTGAGLIGLYYSRGTVKANSPDIMYALTQYLDVTGTITLDNNYIFIRCHGTGPYTVTLPPIATYGKMIISIWVRDAATVTVTVAGNGSELIARTAGVSPVASIALASKNNTITLIADDSLSPGVWYVLGSN